MSKWLLAQLTELQDDLETYGMTEQWKVRKRLAFTAVRGCTVLRDYEKLKAKDPSVHVAFLEPQEPMSDSLRADIEKAVQIRRAIMKRTAELNRISADN